MLFPVRRCRASGAAWQCWDSQLRAGGAGPRAGTQLWLPLTQSCPCLGASAFSHALQGESQPLGRATPGHLRFGAAAATAQTFNFNVFLSLLSLKRNRTSVSVSSDSIKEYQLHCESNLFFSMYSLNSRLLLCYLMELMV